MKFDYYISLGDNCEVGLQFRRVGYEESSFFRFTYCPPESLLSILKNDFDGIFEYQNLIPWSDDMVKDTKYGICFHSEMESRDYKGGRKFIQTEEDRMEIYKREKEKVVYLYEKWKRQLADNKRILYFIKSKEPQSLDFYKQVLDYIDNAGGKNFKFVCLSTCDVDVEKVDDRIVVERLERFAPESNAWDALTDEYDRLFYEYGLLGRKEAGGRIISPATYDPGKPLISLHLPKTAGTAFQRVLENWFGDRLFFHYTDYYRNLPPVKHNIYEADGSYKKGVCIHGHFAHNEVFDYYGYDMSQFISIIRDPYEAHLSMYFYVKKLGDRAPKNHPVKKKLEDPGYTVVDYLRDFKKITYFWFFYPGINLANYKSVIDEKFVFIGLTERMQDSVDKLSTVLGFDTVRMGVSNASDWDEDVPEECRAEFERENSLAVAVYDYVKEKFF